MLIKNYLSLVKFSHTIFSLPFALIGFFLGTIEMGSLPSWKLFALVILSVVFARNAAMGFNRYIDRNIDKDNPRTEKREIAAGILSARSALIFVIVNAILFIGTTWFINELCFYLSPVALFVVLSYSYTKRFTALCHLVLGAGLALAPIGAYLAVTATFDLVPLLISFAVLFWVGGFDVIYALQDEEYDRDNKLQSIPAKIGAKNSLILSLLLHFLTFSLLLVAGLLIPANLLYWIGFGVFSVLLFYQHFIVKPSDISKVNLAFFTLNGIASVIFGAFVIASLFITI